MVRRGDPLQIRKFLIRVLFCAHHDPVINNANHTKDNGLSLPDSTDPPDDFEMLLDEALNAHPDLNTVVTDWDVLHTFWEVLHRSVCTSIKVNSVSQHHSHEANDRNHRLIFDLEILTGATGQ